MNKPQKILTVVFLLAFVATLGWIPWKDSTSISYYPILIPPGYGHYQLYWTQLLIEWLALAIVYAGLRAVLKK